MVAAPQTTKEKPAKPRKKNPQKPANPEISLFQVVFGFFWLFQKSSRFVYPAVVLRFSQKHTCLEQSESFFGLFDLSSQNDHFFLGSGGSRMLCVIQVQDRCDYRYLNPGTIYPWYDRYGGTVRWYNDIVYVWYHGTIVQQMMYGTVVRYFDDC